MILGEAVPMRPQATVIIPTYQDWDRLNACLDCLAGQSADAALFEVIVANNNPAPEVPASLRLPSNARVIHVAKPGSYAARNAALQEARGDVLFFTDSDCQPDRHWIEAGLAAIATLGPRDLIAGGIEVFPAGDRWTATELYDRVHQLRQQDIAGKGWCLTANLVAPREAFEHFGPFSEERFSGGDNEWTSQATSMGSRLDFRSDVAVRHPARAKLSELAKKRRRLAGGMHDAEKLGLKPKSSLASHLSFIGFSELQRTMSSPHLSERQRLQVLGVCFLLGVVWFFELARLRYFSGTPNRS
jgi:glycosyltransferase involved in cell wall biosynthesis